MSTGEERKDGFNQENFDQIKHEPVTQLDKDIIKEAAEFMRAQMKLKQGEKAKARSNANESHELSSRPALEIPSFMVNNQNANSSERYNPDDYSLSKLAKLNLMEAAAEVMKKGIQSQPDYEFPYEDGSLRVYNFGKLPQEVEAIKSGRDYMPEIPARGISYKGLGLHCFMQSDKDGIVSKVRFGFGKIINQDRFANKTVDHMNELVGDYVGKVGLDNIGLNFGVLEPKSFAMDPDGKKHYSLQRTDRDKDR